MKINFLLGFFCCLLVLSSCATINNFNLPLGSGVNQTNDSLFIDTWGGHLRKQHKDLPTNF
jgi:hypothetical protein